MAVTVIASSSDRTSARHAATYSPMLCPSIACGRIPCAIHHCASEYSSENSAGCVMFVRFNWSAAKPEFAALGYRISRRIQTEVRPIQFRTPIETIAENGLARIKFGAHVRVLQIPGPRTGTPNAVMWTESPGPTTPARSQPVITSKQPRPCCSPPRCACARMPFFPPGM